MNRIPQIIYCRFLTPVIVMICFSCSTNINEELLTTSDRYSFDEIIYLGRDFKLELSSELKETFTFDYRNKEEGTWVKSYPLLGVNNTSHFESKNSVIYSFFTDSIYLQTPIKVQNDSVILGDLLLRLSSLDVTPSAITICDSLYIEPNTKTQISYSLIKEILYVNFILAYKNNISNEREYLEGLWIGCRYIDYNREVNVLE